MERRTNESPMDFEWQNGGPKDLNSPFHQFTLKYQQSQMSSQSQKRNRTVFDSPGKPDVPSLREPRSQTFLFNAPLSPTKTQSALPSIPRLNSAFTTPRKFDLDFSSGPEPASSPDAPDDTPEPAFTGKNKPSAPVADRPHPVKEKSFMARLSEIGRVGVGGSGADFRKPYTDALVRRVKRRRHKDKEHQRMVARRGSDDSDRGGSREGGDESWQRTGAPPARAPPTSLFHSILQSIESHPHVPSILSFYAQCTLNVFFAFGAAYIVYSFWATIQADVQMASEEAAAGILSEIAACAREFVENRCDRSSRVPAMEAMCSDWERCMNRDANAVGRARVSAHTFAQIFNSFVEPITWKTFTFSVILLISFVAVNNWTFSHFRHKVAESQFSRRPPPSQQFMYQPHQQYLQSGHPYDTPHRVGNWEPDASMPPPAKTPRLEYGH